MVFQNAIKVRSKQDEFLKQELPLSIAPQLEISLNDLVAIEQAIQKDTKRVLSEKPVGFIDGNYKERPLHFCEYATNPGRSISSEQFDYKEVPYGKQIVIAKGSGFWTWISTNPKPTFEKRGVQRNYPILKKDNAQLSTHKMWGGQTTKSARQEYLNALILNNLIARHSLPQSTYKPLRIIKFNELPVLEDGKMKLCSLEDYCDTTFTDVSDSCFDDFSIPTLQQVKDLAELIYIGELVNLRVPPLTFRIEGDQRFHSIGIFSGQISSSQQKEIFEKFTTNLASLVRTVHQYKGSFTTLRDNKAPLSSLSGNNVSLGGIVCDLDTLKFQTQDKEKLKRLQKWDLEIAKKTLKCFISSYGDSEIYFANLRRPNNEKQSQCSEKEFTGLFNDIYHKGGFIIP